MKSCDITCSPTPQVRVNDIHLLLCLGHIGCIQSFCEDANRLAADPRGESRASKLETQWVQSHVSKNITTRIFQYNRGNLRSYPCSIPQSLHTNFRCPWRANVIPLVRER